MKRTTITLCIITALLVNASCSKFEQMNHNHNQVVYGESTPSKLLADVIYSGHWTIFYRSWRINSQLMQYGTFVNGQELICNYDIKAVESTNLWNNLYRWGAGAAHMYDLALARNDRNSQAIALTMKAYISEAITCVFGDCPYSEAYSWSDGVSHPKYDTQEEIYTQIVKELDAANALYDISLKMDYPERDILFNGDIMKWKKFTNSLRFRYLMRMSKCDCTEVDVPSELDMMANRPDIYPMFESNADAAILRYSGINPNYNGFGSTTATDPMSQNNRLCERLVKLMTDCSDPRLPKYADARNGEYLGIRSGELSDYIAANVDLTCNYAKGLSTDTSPSTLMNYSEILFLKSEACFRGLIDTDKTAGEWYDEAVTASVRERLCDESWAPGAFLTPPSTAAYDGTLERIMEQKYVAMFLVGFEAWCDYRRTGMPRMPHGPAMVLADVPARLRYPLITQTTNAENWKAAVSRLETGEDDMVSKLWFASGTNY